jgi:hypothetical protein
MKKDNFNEIDNVDDEKVPHDILQYGWDNINWISSSIWLDCVYMVDFIHEPNFIIIKVPSIWFIEYMWSVSFVWSTSN